jgi:PAS domain S-box-containing protein
MAIYLNMKFKRMNNDLFYREELFNVIGSNVDDVFVIYDVINMKYEYVSPNFQKVIGYSSKILYDINMILPHIPEIYREHVKELYFANYTQTTEFDFEYLQPLKNQYQWVMIRVYPVYKLNVIIRYITCITDITKEKRSEKEKENALMIVQKANEAKKDFLSYMSHELKNPINTTIGMTQIALMHLDNKEKVEDCLNKINFSSNNLLALINNILDISKLDCDKLVLVHEPFSLSEILSPFKNLENMQAELNSKEYIFITKDLQDDYLIGDSYRLAQIIGNCISNSLKFTPQGGKVKLEITEIEKLAHKALFRIVISDTGKGMSEEFLKNIFIPYNQEDSTISHKYGGTGIGMSITKNLVELMGGNIKVESKVNQGTKISINLAFPICNDFPKSADKKESERKSSNYDCQRKRILVVEDNEINQEIAREFLNFINAVTEEAMNGYEAIKLFEASEPGYYDVILMDLHIPEMDGYETTKTIRNSAHPNAKTICIIAMTADGFADSQLSIDCGMNYHITKPIDIENLCTLLQNIFSK